MDSHSYCIQPLPFNVCHVHVLYAPVSHHLCPTNLILVVMFTITLPADKPVCRTGLSAPVPDDGADRMHVHNTTVLSMCT